ncbi:MAG: hypothetical protein IKX11_06755 [Bacteroidales bacterium]|nr:hypothetical protein [Bacteroidales bacterium]
MKDLLVDASPDLLAHNYAVGYTLFRKSGEDADPNDDLTLMCLRLSK